MVVSVRDESDAPVPNPVVQTGRWRALVTALVIGLLVAVPVVLVLTQGDDSAPPSGSASDPVSADPTSPEPTPVDEWRAEAWRGVQVRVPADWAVGGSPQSDGGSAGMIQCGGVVDEDLNPVEGVPYVGRPVSMTDMCLGLDQDDLPEPTASYVWLDSPLEAGEETWDNGFTSETVEVGGQHVSVATDDAVLRAEILASVEEVETDAYGCPQSGRDVPPSGGAEGRPDRLAICVYDSVGLGGGLDWSGEVGAAAAGEFVDSVAGRADPVDCRQHLNEQWGVLYVEAGGATTAYALDLRCGLIRPPRTAGDHPVVHLRPENIEPWWLPGVRAYVQAPPGRHPELEPYFRGLPG